MLIVDFIMTALVAAFVAYANKPQLWWLVGFFLVEDIVRAIRRRNRRRRGGD